MSLARELTEQERKDWLAIERATRRIVDPERHDQPDDPDKWMPEWKLGDTAGAQSIPPEDAA